MGSTFTLITAVLMTLAALAWGFSLYVIMQSAEGWPLMNVMVFLTFAALAGIYWMMYFRRKNANKTGTE